MAFVAIAERRLKPGRTGAYLAALAALPRPTSSSIAGGGELRAVVHDHDPGHALVFGRWASAAEYDAVMAALPPALMAQAGECVEAPVGPVRWHRIVREIERVAVRAEYMVVRRYTIPPAHWEPFERWIADLMRELVELRGVVSQALLVDLDEPARVVSLIEYAEPSAAALALELAAARPPPSGLDAIQAERFAGRIDLIWTQPRRVGS